MDVEREVAAKLAEETGMRVFLEVPAARPAEFVSVELTGGGGRLIGTLTLAVQSWATTRKRAAEIAGLVRDAVPALEDLPNVFAPVAVSTYRWPDPESNQKRYQTTVELTVCE